MAERSQVYRCSNCGCMCAVVRGGAGDLSCCGTDMELHQDVHLASHEVAGVPPMELNLSLSAKAVLGLIQQRVAEETSYFGVKTLKNPLDFWVYQELLWAIRPDVIVEIGNAYGGSALALAHLLDGMANGRIIAVDIQHDTFVPAVASHPRIQLVTEDACAAIDTVRGLIQPGETVLVIEDSLHTYENTLGVLEAYGPLVTPGSYLIVEDTHCHHGIDFGTIPGPYEAVAAFLKSHPEFETDRERESFFLTFNPTGYLRRIG